ncbi:hypothetical protein C7S20_07180 [Christiangramia fulva]|uniref:TolC family protein n=1 Tax=Christiangramia fulva TaxID=2126553 RepID=A0A2R3Z4B0_9FLAO|nr:TolC family protein [Christiangramia fulva]AVR45068.1 hypothetical protein C7S20_07180 [Christiangramia fulva]
MNRAIPLSKISKLILVFFVFVSCGQTGFAQEQVLEVDLPTLLKAGGADNLIIERYKKEQDLARAQYLKAKSWWLPTLSLGTRTNQLWGAAMNSDGGFFLDVDRANMWLGAEAELAWDFGKAPYKVKAESLRLEAASYRTKEEKNQMLLKLINTYYDLKKAQLDRKAYEEMLKIADTVTRQVEVQVEGGFRYRSEALTSATNARHLEIQLINAQTRFEKQKEKLRELLDVDNAVKIIPADELLLPLNLNKKSDDLVEVVDGKRPGIKALEKEVEALQELKKQTTTGLLLPELSVLAYGSYFGGLLEEVEPVRPSEEPDPKTFYPTSAVTVSMIWKLPLGRIFYKGELKHHEALIDLEENKLEQFKNKVTREVKSARAEVENTRKQLNIAEEAQDLAAEALSQSIERQKLGTAAPFEVFQAQEYYLRSRLDYLNVVSNYNKAQYQLYVALGNNL